MIELIFWGVRGTNPVCGVDYKVIGGHTSCVSLKVNNDPIIILDAGSGLQDLGNQLIKENSQDVHLFISHPHLDHLMGLPFFAPLWTGHCRLNIYATDEKIEHTIRNVLLTPPLFPVTLDEKNTKVIFHKISREEAYNLGQTKITSIPLRHPGGSSGYKLEMGGKSICYITDVEHENELDLNLINFIKGTNLLIYDATYTENEYAKRQGWGHSTNVRAAEVAKAANVGELALFHQDPSHTDLVSEQVESDARKIFPNTFAARQGMKILI